MKHQEYLEFAKEIAQFAKEVMIKYFYNSNGETYKEDETIVTLADKEINDYLIKRVKEAYPGHAVDGEEKSFGESEYIWVCDPVDGTAMYARNIPVAVFSLALVIDGKAEVAVVLDPFTDNLYHSIINEGAYKNDQQIFVNDFNLSDKESIAHFDMWKNAEYNLFDALKELGKQTYFIGLGSIIRSSMAVASGDFIFAIFPGTKGKNCDIAAASLIVSEAGGVVTDLFGETQRYDQDIKGAIISNKTVHLELLSIIVKNLA